MYTIGISAFKPEGGGYGTHEGVTGHFKKSWHTHAFFHKYTNVPQTSALSDMRGGGGVGNAVVPCKAL